MLKNVAFVLAVIAASSLFVGASVANAARYAVDLTAEHLAAYGASTDESAEYYTLGLPIPEVIRGKELYGAYVELYVDVESVEKDGPVVDTPVLEVFALKSAFAGQVDEQQLGAPAFGPRNVARGEERAHIRVLDGHPEWTFYRQIRSPRPGRHSPYNLPLQGSLTH
jgi:hypothetical protein